MDLKGPHDPVRDLRTPALLVALFDERVTLRAHAPLPPRDGTGRGPATAALDGRLESLDCRLRRRRLYPPVGRLLAHLALQFLLLVTQRSMTFFRLAHSAFSERVLQRALAGSGPSGFRSPLRVPRIAGGVLRRCEKTVRPRERGVRAEGFAARGCRRSDRGDDYPRLSTGAFPGRTGSEDAAAPLRRACANSASRRRRARRRSRRTPLLVFECVAMTPHPLLRMASGTCTAPE